MTEDWGQKMSDQPNNPIDPQEDAPGDVAEPVAADATDQTLEPSEEIEFTSATVIDTDLGRLLTTPVGLSAAVEALLFATPEPLTVRRMSQAMGIQEPQRIREAIEDLRSTYDSKRRGLQIIETAKGYRMATREMFGDLILRLRHRKRRPTFSPVTLETLAIIAYRQPIIRAEIESIRGVESSGVLRNLMDMDLVEIVGRKEVLGRPPMYGTTNEFLMAFGLKTVKDLPPIAELKERFAKHAEEAEAAEIAAAEAAAAEASKEDPPPDPQDDLPFPEDGEQADAPEDVEDEDDDLDDDLDDAEDGWDDDGEDEFDDDDDDDEDDAEDPDRDGDKDDKE